MTTISTTLRESVFVRCPESDVHRYLVEHFASRNGHTPTIHLRVPLGDLALDREVVVSLTDLPSKPAEHVMELSWAAKGGGPYPTFIGSLACLRADTLTSNLELEGAYTVPGGLLGKVFDATLGHPIAVAASHSLLATLGEIVATAHEREQALVTLNAPTPYPASAE